MNIDVIENDFGEKIVKKKDFFADLIKYTNIDQSLIRKAINYMSDPPHDLYYLETPRIEEVKKIILINIKKSLG